MKWWLLVALALLLAAAAPASSHDLVGDTTRRETAPLFAAGGSALTNGWFFPGTGVYDGYEIQGEPYQIARGTDIELTTFDGTLTLGNGHQIKSFKKRKNGRPLFQSKFVADGETTLMITSHLKPGRGEQPGGVYGYFCTVHFQMYGLLEVTRS